MEALIKLLLFTIEKQPILIVAGNRFDCMFFAQVEKRPIQLYAEYN